MGVCHWSIIGMDYFASFFPLKKRGNGGRMGESWQLSFERNDTFHGSGNRKKKNDEEEKTSSCPARDLDEG